MMFDGVGLFLLASRAFNLSATLDDLLIRQDSLHSRRKHLSFRESNHPSC
jgi:hypothetical protein